MKRFQNIQEPWGEFVHIKTNSPQILKRELERKAPGHVWISSVTDAYMPLEHKTRLTRNILETIDDSPHNTKFSFEILTKSSLVERDFDLLEKLDFNLGCSINTLNGQASHAIEPRAAKPESRITTLRRAKERGISVYGFVSPVIPGITNLAEIFDALQFTEYVWVELLNTKASVLSNLLPTLRRYFPDSAKALSNAIAKPDSYYKEIVAEVRDLERKYGLKVKDIVRHQ